jgi:hypothetical protein
VLDLSFAAGPHGRLTLEASREWVKSKRGFEGSLSLSGSAGNGWGPGWLPVGGGVVYVEDGPGLRQLPPSRPSIPRDPLEPQVYHWSQTLRYPVYWLILKLPPGTTLKSSNPEPNSAGDLGDRFTVFWESFQASDQVWNTDISWELEEYAGEDRDLEVNRLRAQLPLSAKRRASALTRITYMKRGLGVLLLVIALIALWICLPSGLAISPPHISTVMRIPATAVFIVSAILSIMGLAKGWSLATLFTAAGSTVRNG